MTINDKITQQRNKKKYFTVKVDTMNIDPSMYQILLSDNISNISHAILSDTFDNCMIICQALRDVGYVEKLTNSIIE
jgi:hypothetical protein